MREPTYLHEIRARPGGRKEDAAHDEAAGDAVGRPGPGCEYKNSQFAVQRGDVPVGEARAVGVGGRKNWTNEEANEYKVSLCGRYYYSSTRE